MLTLSNMTNTTGVNTLDSLDEGIRKRRPPTAIVAIATGEILGVIKSIVVVVDMQPKMRGTPPTANVAKGKRAILGVIKGNVVVDMLPRMHVTPAIATVTAGV